MIHIRQQFAFFKDGLSDKAFTKYIALIQEEVEKYFTTEWGEEGEADLLQSLSDVFTLTSSRCLLGEEIRKRWNDSGMAEHYCKLFRLELLRYWRVCRTFTLRTLTHFLSLLIHQKPIINLQSPWIIHLFPFSSSFRGSQIPIEPSASKLVNCLKRFLQR